RGGACEVQRDVAAAERATRAVVGVPAGVERHLVLIASGRQIEAGLPDAVFLIEVELRGIAGRRPVLAATDGLLQVADQGDTLGLWALSPQAGGGHHSQNEGGGEWGEGAARALGLDAA